MSFEHQVELPRRSQILAAAIWTLFNAFLLRELISAQMCFASPAIDHRIRKSFHMTGCL
jgi:hypothetical protein